VLARQYTRFPPSRAADPVSEIKHLLREIHLFDKSHDKVDEAR
jgi:hypothetical protein